MNALFPRVKNMLIRPGQEWQAVRDEATTYDRILFRYVGILAVIPPAAAVTARMIFDGPVPNGAPGSSLLSAALTNTLWYCMYVLNVMTAGMIVTAVMASPGSRWDALQGFKIAAYSFTPLFIAGFIAVLPRMGWIIDAAILYSVYLLYLGIRELASLGKGRAAWYALGSFLSAAVIVGAMNLLEYYLESFVVSKIVS
ncbi:MAG TPA: Yip1 family protein [Nitrospirota bacterium]|nr:Yip1 family protein [Nitrospirota bacterium]